MDIYGHRGAKGVIMENSLQGFIHATSQGIDKFELDVQLSSDNQLIVIHDQKLKRLTNTSLRVSKCTANTLSKTLLTGTDQGIPTLEQVVAACPFVKHWQFEIKTQTSNPKFVRPMKRLIEKYNLQKKVVITSIHVGILKIFQRILPEINRGYVQKWALPSGIKTALKLQCTYLVLNKRLAYKHYIHKAQAKGLKVSIWTVNKKEDMNRLNQFGADSIISDFPMLAKEELKKQL